MTLQASVSMSWVNTVLAAAERAGVPRERLLAQAGIAPEELAHERWPIDHITRLWRAAVHCTQDAGFGLKAGAGVGPASFNVVSYLLQSAPTLRAALALVARNEAVLGIVYSTDARVEPGVKVVGTFPASSYPAIVYPVAATSTAHKDTADYLAFLRSSEAKAIFEKHGFTFLVDPTT